MERFIIQPSIKLFGGITVTKETKFKDNTPDGKIKQELNNLKLTTKVKRQLEYKGIITEENTTLTQTIPEGTRLVWSEEEGYVIPPYKMYTIQEAIDELKGVII